MEKIKMTMMVLLIITLCAWIRPLLGILALYGIYLMWAYMWDAAVWVYTNGLPFIWTCIKWSPAIFAFFYFGDKIGKWADKEMEKMKK